MLRSMILPACLAAPLLLGCGSRSQLDALGLSGGGTGGGIVPPTDDPCPAAVLGPKAMAGNCSTRDGRSRVAAPSAPHVTWMMKLPVDSTGQAGPSAIATDASGHAYVMTEGEADESVSGLRRVNVADGSVDWTDAISPDQETATPIVLAHGGVDLCAYDAQTMESVFTFDPASGASTSTTFGFSLYYAPSDLAVGADGSLYVTHEDGVGTVKQTTFVSRVAPGGGVLWTSVDLGTVAAPDASGQGEIFPSTIALGKGDLVVLEADVITKAGVVASVIALDPATGAVRWTTNLDAQAVGGPAVRADGGIVFLLSQMGASQLVVLDPESGTPTTTPLSGGAFQIAAITRDGAVIGGADAGNGLVAIGSDGSMLWTGPGGGKATIASDGTVVSFGTEITALDGATGQMKWQLAPPTPGSCILEGALTSEGGLVGLQCDGTLFGASD